MNCDSQGEYWNYVNTFIARINNVKLSEQLLVIGYTIPGTEGNVINCVIEEAKWVAWKRRCTIRYEDKWINDVQMIRMFKARVKNRL